MVQQENMLFFRHQFSCLLSYFQTYQRKHSNQANMIKIRELKKIINTHSEELEIQKREVVRANASYRKYKNFFLDSQKITRIKVCFFESFNFLTLNDTQDVALLKTKLKESLITIEKICTNYEKIIQLHRDLDVSQAHAEKLFLHIKFLETICVSSLNSNNKIRRIFYYCSYFSQGGLLHSLTLPQFTLKTLLSERRAHQEKVQKEYNDSVTNDIEDDWNFLKYTNLQQYYEPV
jgi:hypothetical protein